MKLIMEILDFYGEPKVARMENGDQVFTVESAEHTVNYGGGDVTYYWVSIKRGRPTSEHMYDVVAFTSPPHIPGALHIESVRHGELEWAVKKAFKMVAWNFPKRPQNVQEWSER
jgi:hypothetical protein